MIEFANKFFPTAEKIMWEKNSGKIKETGDL